MILSEVVKMNDGECSVPESDGFALCSGEIIDSSTPRKGRSVSYLELTSSYNEASILSDTSLQRMRCLSQSINDLKILRERQEERRHNVEDLLNDEFLQEHARKLKDARSKIKELEAKYQNQPRLKSKFDVSSVDKKRRELMSGLEDTNKSLGNAGEDITDGYSGTAEVQNEITEVNAEPTRKSRKPRPLTWAIEDDFSYSSDCNSFTEYYNSRTEGTTSHNLTPRKHSISNTTITSKWRSLPNLPNENSFLENRALMYGEAIPVDPTRVTKKHNAKFTRKSGFYKVNESTEKTSNHSTKKRKFREKWFGRKGVSKKHSQKLVSPPKEGLALGRVVRFHPSIHNAYTIELNRSNKGSFGFHIRQGYEQNEAGIFVYNIVDKKAEKFLSGLLHVGDEILEINDTNVREKSLDSVKKLMKNVDKLELSILPYSSRKER